MRFLLRSAANSSSSFPCRVRYQPPAAAAIRHFCASSTGTAGNTVSIGGSSSSRRSLLMGAALFATHAGVKHPWSSAATPPTAAAAVRTAAMSTAAAAAAAGGGSGQDAGTGLIVVYVTAPNSEVAEKIASSLVEQQMVACVNITPGITSVYRWQGKLEKDSEVLMIMKTRSSLLDQLTSKVKELHPYDEPEVIAMPVIGGSSGYIKWVKDNTQAA